MYNIYNTVYTEQVTALYLACETGQTELALLLLKEGAEPNIPAIWSNTTGTVHVHFIYCTPAITEQHCR